jgi:dipeptidyl-peptidase-3
MLFTQNASRRKQVSLRTDDPTNPPPIHDTRLVGELERLGPGGRDVMVLGLESPGFDDLPVEKKFLAYYLYRAAIAGNDIMYEQAHRHALEIRQLLETIYTHSDGLPDTVRDSVHDYLKYIWIHHGNYHHSSHSKFLPNTLTRQQLAEAAAHAVRRGARIESRPGESLAAKLDRLDRTIFDPNYEPLQTNQAEGADIVATSAINYYDPGVTYADIDSLPPEWKTRINVRFAKQDGRIIPQPYRIGGLFTGDLETVHFFLEKALPYAESESQRKSIELLMAYYRSGDEATFREHSVHWLKSSTTIDYLNGFIEQYLDPRGIIGSFEGNVSMAVNDVIVERIAANALYFETRMPWPDRYKRSKIDLPVATLVNVIVETGDAGPVSPAAYNLPNYNDIRRDHGSKNVIFLNVESTRSESIRKKMVNEFYLPEYRDNVFKYGVDKVRPLEVYMHEIIGHGSGQPDLSLAVDPREALGRVYSPLEECRSDLVALYHMSDPKLVEIGALEAGEQQAIVETAYITYLQGWMTRFDRLAGYEVREAHSKGHHLILMYLVENGGDPQKDFGVEVVRHDGDFYVVLRDPVKMRRGLGELLERLQVLKSTGDGNGSAELFDRFASRVNPEWYDNVVSRLRKLNIPRQKAFVFPRLVPEMRAGRIVDVRLVNDEDLTAQQLRFSRMRYVKDIAVS